MDLTIHNVGHGLCISLTHENGNVMLWDCGHQGDYRPSDFLRQLGIQRIDRFFVTNYDEDHISDLPNLRAKMAISMLHINKTISSANLRAMKLESGPLTVAMESMLSMIDNYTASLPEPPPPFPDVEYVSFHNSYGARYIDTNNLSLTTFVTCNGTRFFIPGDVEKEGWDGLMAKPGFIEQLRRVHVFVAPHHGQENGYSADVMNIASPNVVVFSDSPVVHATQEMVNAYAQHCGGIMFNNKERKVLSTRNDGSLTWSL